MISTLISPFFRWRQRWRHRRRIRRNPLYDFGAMQSLRERLAVGENLHSNAWDDTIKHCSVLQVEIVRALAEYLENRDIDSTGLREEAKTDRECVS